MKILFHLLFLIAIATSGCTTKSAARAQSAANARAAYEAGRAQAYQQMLQSQATGIHVSGHVTNPEIPWEDGLTLSQVIVDAQCTDQGNPRTIIIIRKGVRYPIDVSALLKGEDWPMEPGDTVEIHP